MAEVKTKTLTNNTKGLRHVVGLKVLPGKSVAVDAAAEKLIKANPVAVAWIESGDLTLK